MNRQQFIKVTTLGGLALSVMPFRKAFAGSLTNDRVLKMPLSVHVRHGLLVNKTESIGWPYWVKGIQKDVFFENGYQQDKDDLTSLKFEIDQRPVSIQLIDRTLWMQIGENDPTEVNLAQTGRMRVQDPSGWSITAYQLDNRSLELTNNGQFIVIPLRGSCDVNGVEISEERAFSLSRKELIKASANGKCQLLVLHKNENRMFS